MEIERKIVFFFTFQCFYVALTCLFKAFYFLDRSYSQTQGAIAPFPLNDASDRYIVLRAVQSFQIESYQG